MNELQHSPYIYPSARQKHAFRYLHSIQAFSQKHRTIVATLGPYINPPLRSAPIPIITTAEYPQYNHKRYSLSLPPIASFPFQLMPLVFLS